MREISLDFQPRRPRPLSVVLLGVALLLCADAWLEYADLGERSAELGRRLAIAQRRADLVENGRREARPENAFSAEESKALRQAIGAIRVDWEGLFQAIEQAGSEDVSLLAIRPNVAGKSVQIAGEARDLAATLAFVEALQHPPLAHAVLLSHQVKQGDPQHPIVFEISATWLTGS